MTEPNHEKAADYRRLMKDALVELESLQGQVAALRRAKSEPIAVVGIGCRFPGGADSPAGFWRVLHEGIDTVREVPPERWPLDAFYNPDPEVPGKVYCRQAALLDQDAVERFDPDFFGIAPREAGRMDPQQRLLLEVCWEALEDAAVPVDRTRGSLTGLFVGSCTDDYLQLFNSLADPASVDGYSSLGTARSITVGRVSYLLGFEGPAVQLDTACSSSLVAVHQACQSLRAGECDMALAGGVNLQLSPVWTVGLSKLGALSPSGRCRTFDAKADGFVRGEGCGVVVLKRLSDAVAGQDRILALIRGSAVNHDGRSSGLTVPNPAAQAKVLRRALEVASLQPEDVGYIEAHGTGTSLGDPIEMAALGSLFGRRQAPLWVGSVKTNVGHLEAAAGIVGLVKVVLALTHEEIPPHLHFHEPNPHVPWDELPVRIPTRATPWPRGERRRRAGVSSFGFSGTNAHVLLEEAPLDEGPSTPGRPCHLLLLSAKDPQALRELAGRYAALLAEEDRCRLGDVCHTAALGRSHFKHRLAVAARSVDEAREQLETFARTGVCSTDCQSVLQEAARIANRSCKRRLARRQRRPAKDPRSTSWPSATWPGRPWTGPPAPGLSRGARWRCPRTPSSACGVGATGPACNQPGPCRRPNPPRIRSWAVGSTRPPPRSGCSSRGVFQPESRVTLAITVWARRLCSRRPPPWKWPWPPRAKPSRVAVSS